MADSPITSNEIVPDFSVPMTGNQLFTLSSYRGKNLILFFYPKDNTPGCTTESMAFRDLHPQFQQYNCEIFGISRDSILSHEGFKSKLALPFELISDPDETACTLFNVMKIKNMYGKKVRGIARCTFVVDSSGRLVKEWRDIKIAGHVDDVLAFASTLHS